MMAKLKDGARWLLGAATVIPFLVVMAFLMLVACVLYVIALFFTAAYNLDRFIVDRGLDLANHVAEWATEDHNTRHITIVIQDPTKEDPHSNSSN